MAAFVIPLIAALKKQSDKNKSSADASDASSENSADQQNAASKSAASIQPSQVLGAKFNTASNSFTPDPQSVHDGLLSSLAPLEDKVKGEIKHAISAGMNEVKGFITGNHQDTPDTTPSWSDSIDKTGKNFNDWFSSLGITSEKGKPAPASTSTPAANGVAAAAGSDKTSGNGFADALSSFFDK